MDILSFISGATTIMFVEFIALILLVALHKGDKK